MTGRGGGEVVGEEEEVAVGGGSVRPSNAEMATARITVKPLAARSARLLRELSDTPNIVFAIATYLFELLVPETKLAAVERRHSGRPPPIAAPLAVPVSRS